MSPIGVSYSVGYKQFAHTACPQGLHSGVHAGSW